MHINRARFCQLPPSISVLLSQSLSEDISMLTKFVGICEAPGRQIHFTNSTMKWTNCILTRRHVRPITRTGFCADWEISNKLYSNVWFLWKINKSNSSSRNRIGRQSLFPKKWHEKQIFESDYTQKSLPKDCFTLK